MLLKQKTSIHSMVKRLIQRLNVQINWQFTQLNFVIKTKIRKKGLFYTSKKFIFDS